MLESLLAFTNNILDPIGIWLGVVFAVPIFWTWWDVSIGRRRRYRKWFHETRREPGERPAVLIVDLLAKKNVRTAVEHHRANNEVLKAVPDERVFTVTREARLQPDDAPGLAQEIQAAAAEILRSGADVVHYFHAGPVFAAALVGAEFANAGCRVLLYQNEQGTYANFGPLRHPGF